VCAVAWTAVLASLNLPTSVLQLIAPGQNETKPLFYVVTCETCVPPLPQKQVTLLRTSSNEVGRHQDMPIFAIGSASSASSVVFYIDMSTDPSSGCKDEVIKAVLYNCLYYGTEENEDTTLALSTITEVWKIPLGIGYHTDALHGLVSHEKSITLDSAGSLVGAVYGLGALHFSLTGGQTFTIPVTHSVTTTVYHIAEMGHDPLTRGKTVKMLFQYVKSMGGAMEYITQKMESHTLTCVDLDVVSKDDFKALTQYLLAAEGCIDTPTFLFHLFSYDLREKIFYSPVISSLEGCTAVPPDKLAFAYFMMSLKSVKNSTTSEQHIDLADFPGSVHFVHVEQSLSDLVAVARQKNAMAVLLPCLCPLQLALVTLGKCISPADYQLKTQQGISGSIMHICAQTNILMMGQLIDELGSACHKVCPSPLPSIVDMLMQH